ncbi:alpha/beta fold hydrolase [Janibacter melonis]|uniref:alpha/beta fold hydrolase n=1 Tax=Janibacter melonis TaxID=262209 RepID=UPI00174925F7|nr:alpha/beta hydrolase [Janibacter melonis]
MTRTRARFLTPDGTSFVEHRPEGSSTRTALLLHGIGGNAATFEELGNRLAARGVRAIAWDAPGYGRSRDPRGPVDVVDQLASVISTRRWGPVDLIGTSWGGVIATVLAHRRPTTVRSLVLADSTRGSAVDTVRAEAMRARVAELRALGAEELAARRAGRLVSPHADDDVALQVRRHMSRVRLPGYTAAAHFMASTDTGPMLAGLDVPTLVLVGEDDVVTGVGESQLLAERIPGASLTIVPQAGHAAVTERPDLVAAAVIDFWAAHDG